MNVYFDIETIPVQDPELIAELRADLDAELEQSIACVRAPSNYKDEAKIADYVQKAQAELRATHETKVEECIHKTSFDGGLGQVCVIGWAFDDGAPMSRHVEDLTPGSEQAVLRHFFSSLSHAYSPTDRICVIGHNIIEFDLRFLWQRAMVLGVKPPAHCLPRDPKPWSETTFDTLLAWSGMKRGGSMSKLCRIFGIEGKGDIDGSMVWPLVKAGRIEEVAAYCRGDVERTRQLHRRMTFASA